MLPADLNSKEDLHRVEIELRSNEAISMLVNNAGFGATTSLLDSDADRMDRMIDLNINAFMRLTYAVVPPMVRRERGTIINVSSIADIVSEAVNGVFGATKAFVIAFSLSLDKELAAKNIRVQVVLPGAIATKFGAATAGARLKNTPKKLMSVENLVDAAMVGLDLGELTTIPSLPNVFDWEQCEDADRICCRSC